MMYGSNMGILPYWLIVLFIMWGLLLTKRRPVLSIKPAIMPQQSLGDSHPRGQRESCCYAQLKHRHPLSKAHKVTWGSLCKVTKSLKGPL